MLGMGRTEFREETDSMNRLTQRVGTGAAVLPLAHTTPEEQRPQEAIDVPPVKVPRKAQRVWLRGKRIIQRPVVS